MKIKNETTIKYVTLYSAYLIIVWGFYRILPKLPETVDELLIKPVVWLAPLIYLLKKEELDIKSLGVKTKKLLPSIYFSLILGVLFAVEGVLINYLKYGKVDFLTDLGGVGFTTLLLLTGVTAFVEEIVFRGYLFNRLWKTVGSEWFANIAITIVWLFVHLPIAIFWWEFDLTSTLTFSYLMVLFSLGSGYIFARTENVFASILLHFLWGWPIILFR